MQEHMGGKEKSHALQGLVLSFVDIIDGHGKCQPHKKLAALELVWHAETVLGGRQGHSKYAWNKNSFAHMATSRHCPVLARMERAQ